MTVSSEDGQAGGQRLVWVDAARGLAVLAVVVFHVSAWWYLPLGADLSALGEKLWGGVNNYLGSLRMPLLLAISGLLASRRVLRGLGERRLRLRIVTNVYLYVVWVAVYALFYGVVPEPSLPHRIDGVLDALRQLVVPETPLWFIFALVLYTTVLGALHRVPPGMVLVAAAALSVAVKTWGDPPGMWPRVLELGVYFAAGVYGAALLRRFVERASILTTLAAGVVAVGVTLLGRFTDPGLGDAVVSLLRGGAFLVAAAAAVGLLARIGPLGRAGQRLGRRTLPIYVLHVPLLALVMVASDATPDVVRSVVEHPTGGVLAPLLVSAVVVVAALVLHTAALRIGLAALFDLPPRWARLVDGGRRPGAAPGVVSAGGEEPAERGRVN